MIPPTKVRVPLMILFYVKKAMYHNHKNMNTFKFQNSSSSRHSSRFLDPTKFPSESFNNMARTCHYAYTCSLCRCSEPRILRQQGNRFDLHKGFRADHQNKTFPALASKDGRQFPHVLLRDCKKDACKRQLQPCQ